MPTIPTGPEIWWVRQFSHEVAQRPRRIRVPASTVRWAPMAMAARKSRWIVAPGTEPHPEAKSAVVLGDLWLRCARCVDLDDLAVRLAVRSA